MQALSSTEGGYDRLAPRFEATPFRTPDAILGAAFADLGEREIPAALDLCCGTGAVLHHLTERAERLVGLDMSAGMLEEARARLPAQVELIRGDALDPPAELLGAFDLVTCFGAFGHVLEADEPRLVDSVRRLLKPGGRFVFVTTEPGGRRVGRAAAHAFNLVMRVRNALWRPPFIMYYLTFELPRARSLLERAGFEVEVARERFPAPFDRLVLVTATRSASVR